MQFDSGSSDLELQLMNAVFHSCVELQDGYKALAMQIDDAEPVVAIPAVAAWEKRRRRLQRQLVKRAQRLVNHWRTHGPSEEYLHSTVHGPAIEQAVTSLPPEEILTPAINEAITEIDATCNQMLDDPTRGLPDSPWENLTAAGQRIDELVGDVVQACTAATNWNLDRNQDFQVQAILEAARTTPGVSLTLDEVAQWPDGGIEVIRHEQINGPNR